MQVRKIFISIALQLFFLLLNLKSYSGVNPNVSVSKKDQKQLNLNAHGIVTNTLLSPNRAFRFSDSGDYVEIPHSSTLAPTNITIECWINLNGQTGEQTIMDKRDANGGYNFRIDGSQYPLGVSMIVKDGTERGIWVGDILQPYTWTHLAATYDGATIKVFINGEMVGSNAAAATISQTLSPLRIGEYLGYPGSSLMVHGLIDDLRLWNRARSATEIKSAMNQFLTGGETGLIGYWKFDETAGTILADASPKHNNGTLHGAAKSVLSTAPIGDEADNRAIRIAQVGARVEIPHSAALSPAQITIECWLRKNSTLFFEYTVVDQRGSGSGYNLRLAGDSFPIGLYIALDGGSTSLMAGVPGCIYPYIWYHVAATYDGTIANVYLNGQLGVSQSGVVDITKSKSPLFIGEFLGYPGASLRLDGDLDELRIWNKVRSQAEIQAAMNKNLSGQEQGLIGYWRFNDSSSATAYDKSGNGNHGSVKAPATFAASDAPVGFVPPPSPIGFRAAGANNQVTLKWKAVPGADVDHYLLYRSVNANFEPTVANLIATIAHPLATYHDAPLVNGQRRFYRLKLVDKQGHTSQLTPEIVGRAAEIYATYFTGVYYYPWYSNSWGHKWPGEFVRDYLQPPQAPVLGQYDSRDRSVLRQQLNWCKNYGIDLWVCSWWGINSGEDITIKNSIKSELKTDDVKFALFYESTMLGNAPLSIDAALETRLKNDFTYIANNYFSHPNYFRINGRPVIYIYLSRIYDGDYANAFTRIRQAMSALGHNVYFIGDEMGFNAPTDHMNFLDAVTSYAMLGNQGYGIDQGTFGMLSSAYDAWQTGAQNRGLKFIPLAMPGFSNRKAGQTTPSASIVVPRQSTEGASPTSYFEEYIKTARPYVDPDLKMIMITSWNEWHEDSQIEPVAIASPTNRDKSLSGTDYTNGYYYEGYGAKFLEVVKELLESAFTAVETTPAQLPLEAILLQNYPNPFNATTTFEFWLPEAKQVTLIIYNVKGEEIVTLVAAVLVRGKHVYRWHPSGLGSGLYLSKLVAGDFIQSRKLILIQ